MIFFLLLSYLCRIILFSWAQQRKWIIFRLFTTLQIGSIVCYYTIVFWLSRPMINWPRLKSNVLHCFISFIYIRKWYTLNAYTLLAHTHTHAKSTNNIVVDASTKLHIQMHSIKLWLDQSVFFCSCINLVYCTKLIKIFNLLSFATKINGFETKWHWIWHGKPINIRCDVESYSCQIFFSFCFYWLCWSEARASLKSYSILLFFNNIIGSHGSRITNTCFKFKQFNIYWSINNTVTQ